MMNLYKVELAGLRTYHAASLMQYHTGYVVAQDSEQAYRLFAVTLAERGRGNKADRQLRSVTLVASEDTLAADTLLCVARPRSPGRLTDAGPLPALPWSHAARPGGAPGRRGVP